MRISRIFLYDEPAVPQINLENLVTFLKRTFRVSVIRKESIFAHAGRETARQLAAARVFDYRTPFEMHAPTDEEIKIEMQSFSNSASNDGIVLYDGFEFQKIIAGLVPEIESTIDNLHVVFTNKLTCTFDYNDYRYHGRALICANPSIISTTGIVEAPAKPRDYYIDMMKNYTQGLNVDSVKEKYHGQYLDYADERLETIVEGYCMQAIFYHITGEPFCDLLDCRLHNAHWQRDLLYSQIEFGKICSKHEDILRRWTALNDLNC
ncbi:MAG: hypothetical protein QXE84_05100 [Candidatus Nitrosotenuis sp.]|uniref:Uncharacterized protein n=1 Tax=Candidatus Nitrosotenuis uzonensis TaxID=1407055 RepID=A0A812F6W0_9ARCH|nr:DUF6775 family putative metallopeptidase [Candidatus Nitrosotenuis uzonensis]MCA2003326.1 hypothetical protein [Candidatus Nitrosotenuis sp.]CAE6501273.1 conserved hypothetical protein [Candidatus Nitrosotenuis uzonensis]